MCDPPLTLSSTLKLSLALPLLTQCLLDFCFLSLAGLHLSLLCVVLSLSGSLVCYCLPETFLTFFSYCTHSLMLIKLTPFFSLTIINIWYIKNLFILNYVSYPMPKNAYLLSLFSSLVPYITFSWVPDPYSQQLNRGHKTYTKNYSWINILKNKYQHNNIYLKTNINNIFELHLSHWILQSYVAKTVDAHFIIHFHTSLSP